MNADNIRVMKGRNGTGFFLKSCDKVGVLVEVVIKNFQRHLPFQLLIFGEVNDPHATSPQFLKHVVLIRFQYVRQHAHALPLPF